MISSTDINLIVWSRDKSSLFFRDSAVALLYEKEEDHIPTDSDEEDSDDPDEE